MNPPLILVEQILMEYKRPSISVAILSYSFILILSFSSISDLTVSVQTAISKNEDLEVIRDLCSTGVPPLARGDVWRAFLGVNRRPDAIGSWNGPLDTENQSQIHQDTISQASVSIMYSSHNKINHFYDYCCIIIKILLLLNLSFIT